jgi:hypothetical protein
MAKKNGHIHHVYVLDLLLCFAAKQAVSPKVKPHEPWATEKN